MKYEISVVTAEDLSLLRKGVYGIYGILEFWIRKVDHFLLFS